MRRRLAVLGLLSLLASLTVPGVAHADPTGYISGQVVTEDSDYNTTPATGACAEATDVATSTVVSTQCVDADGYYAFALAPGSYTVRVYDSGYATQYVTKSSQPQFLAAGAQPLTVTDADTNYTYTALMAGPIVTGLVTDSDGHPLKDIPFCVQAIQASTQVAFDCPQQDGDSWSPGTFALTPLEGLKAGDYNLGFGPNSYSQPIDFEPQWFPGGVVDQSGAQTYTVGSGMSTINLTAVLGGTITGTAYGQDTGQPLTNNDLTCFFAYQVTQQAYVPEPYFASAPTFLSRVCANKLQNGAYVLRGLPTGSYKIDFDGYDGPYYGQWSGGAADQDTATPIAVTAPAATAGIDVTLVRGGTLAGTVTQLSTHAPINNSKYYVEVYNTAQEQVSQWYYAEDDGKYTAYKLHPGTYRIRYVSTIPAAGEQWYGGSADFAHATPVTITSEGQTISGLNQALDDVKPTASTSALPVFSLGKVTFAYAGSDVGTGIGNYDVRYRVAGFDRTFGAVGYPGAWQHTTARSVSLTPTKGATYCFSMRSRDRVGNVSAWSGERCTAAPLDDRALAASSGWTSGTSSAYYASTYRRAAAIGRTLTRTSLQTKRVSIIATTCRGCGTIGIYWNGRLMRQVSLNATATHYRQVVTGFALSAAASGTLVIKSLNANQVLIDGVATSRV